MTMPDKAYVASLSSVKGFGYKTVASLISSFGSAKAVWTASERDLRDKGFSAKIIEHLMQGRKNFSAEKNFQQLMEQGITIVSVFDAEYPNDLKRICKPPVVLYIKGVLPDSHLPKIAIVGTRRATVYGSKVAQKIAGDLCAKGICIVSGMARGIDTFAHKGAIEANGQTIAVLGCGLDVVYPPENRRLAEQIQNCGALISEYPLGTAPDKGNFPARNRIISGLSSGVIVVEAPIKSGALITADFAVEQSREVFAVPGPITSRNSEGCHQLIREGAKLFQGVEDVFEELWDVSKAAEMLNEPVAATKIIDISPQARRILDLLSGGPVFLDELSVHTGMSPSELNILITEMEIEGLITKFAGKIFSVGSQ